MSENNDLNVDVAKSVPDMSEASQLLSQISAIKDRAEAAAIAAEQASQKANSESAFAYNAKNNAEDHAKAISQVRGTADADFAWLTQTKANAEDLAQAISKARVSAENDAQAVANAKTPALQDASSAAAARDGAEKSASAITKLQSDVDSISIRAGEDAAIVTQSKATVEASATAVQTLQTFVTERAAKADGDTSTITNREAESKTLLQSMSDVVTTATQVQDRVTGYEKELESLKKQFNDLHAKTEALLPGATSAGLASAFRDQRARFDRPQSLWLWTFIAAVVALLAAGFVGLPGFRFGGGQAEQASWDTILRHFVNRLPLVAPLIWLGIYAGRNYMFALRMQEEYAFKEAISATFEGYKREMAGIAGASATDVLPLITLCENVLLTVAQRPGRIYEGHQEDITPLAPVTKFVSETMDKASTLVTEAVKKAAESLKSS